MPGGYLHAARARIFAARDDDGEKESRWQDGWRRNQLAAALSFPLKLGDALDTDGVNDPAKFFDPRRDPF